MIALGTAVASLSIAPMSALAELSAPAPTTRPALTYRNPLDVDIADPFVLRVNDTYYLYGTNAPGRGYRVLESRDLIHWDDRGFAFRKTNTSWGRENFWAPCAVEHDGAFYLFYSSVGPVGTSRTSHRICVARANSPLGPFEDVRAPLLDIGKAVIDAHVVVDPEHDGKSYLYFSLDCSENKISEVQVVELSSDLTSVVGKPVPCIKPDQAWEGDTWNEGPFVFRASNGTYVMMYSGRGFFDPLYAIGYATAPSPMGPWTKSKSNPILHRTDDVSGPGHNCVIDSPDGAESFVVYHRHKNIKGGHARELAIDRMTIDARPDGSVILNIDGPSTTEKPMPLSDAAVVK
ncbi:MAG: glycoside hydrolase family 43 protein [Tepidisphaeraceae bacterium]